MFWKFKQKRIPFYRSSKILFKKSQKKQIKEIDSYDNFI